MAFMRKYVDLVVLVLSGALLEREKPRKDDRFKTLAWGL
jgi:hypothetical protein